MARYPVERVAAIIDGEPNRVPTPVTLTGTAGTIYSYSKLIASKQSDGSWNAFDRFDNLESAIIAGQSEALALMEQSIRDWMRGYIDN